jgi:hypothetical protein
MPTPTPRPGASPLAHLRPVTENIDEILDVPGIDAIYVGPADLAFSLGYLLFATSLAKVGVGYGLMLPLSASPPAASAEVYFQSPAAPNSFCSPEMKLTVPPMMTSATGSPLRANPLRVAWDQGIGGTELTARPDPTPRGRTVTASPSL